MQGFIDKQQWNSLRKQFLNMRIDNGEVHYSNNGVYFQFFPEDQQTSGGTTILWAKVTAVTDANNYTVSVWSSRTSYENGDDALATSKQCRVPDIVDSLAVNDLIPVETTTLDGEDYICNQQLGAIG